MNFLKCTIIFLLTINITALQAEWNPDYLPLENKKILQVINDSRFKNLETQVFNEVKNTWCSEEKAKLLLELITIIRPKVCVEIGAFTGSSTLPILAGLKHAGSGKAYIIDAWSNVEAIRGLPINDPNTVWWAGLDMNAVKNQFLAMVKKWSLGSFYQILDVNSQLAVSQIPSIDFLHLDGNFSEEGALLDSNLYLPKVVSGGYVLLSNALVMIEGKPTKMKALWPLFEHCDIVCELDSSNTLLFRKK